jgi:hypothetical protein
MNVTGKCPFCFASYSFDDSQAGAAARAMWVKRKSKGSK